MAVWAEFNDDDEPSDLVPSQLMGGQSRHSTEADYGHVDRIKLATHVDVGHGPAEYVAHALRCYPISENLATFLDLTDLHSLSTTCRLVRESLIQFAPQLKQHSLRCFHDKEDEEEEAFGVDHLDEALALQLSVDDQMALGLVQGPAFPISLYSQVNESDQRQFSHARNNRCARDLVSACRKCGTMVCRNCITKPPNTNRLLAGRLRRLCDSCLDVPLIMHQAPLEDHSEHFPLASSASSTRSDVSDSSMSDLSEGEHHSNLYSPEMLSKMPSAFLRDFCTCASQGVYICQPCGQSNAAADSIYQRVWKWRSRYSTHLGGGLGTGLGLGNQGQKCGRDKYCLATRDAMALIEAEWSSDDVSTPGGVEITRSNTPITYDDARTEPGYFRQEIEGIGGQVKSKSKKLVKVGATVYEFRDERESGKYLGREASGDLRAWCSWCSRVCPGKQDRQQLARV